jgi:rhamnosyltransferase
MKTAGVIIIYKPIINEVRDNIISYVDVLDHLYIVDNSDNSHEDVFLGLSNKIEYIPNFNNLGISKVLNTIAVKSKKAGFSLLLTMDQDSRFPPNMAEKYLKYCKDFDWSDTAMLGINAIDFNKSLSSEEQEIELEYHDVPLLITSGSVINLKLIDKIGYFNEKLFIDCVDYDYCLRARLLKYKVRNIFGIYLFHIGGLPTKFLGRKVALYSPNRYYYIFRNHNYMWYKYIRHFPLLIIKNIIITMGFSLIPNIILSHEKRNFIKSLIRAVKDIKNII